MHGCTHLSRFALVSRVFRGRYAKTYTGYCIIACVPMCLCGRAINHLAHDTPISHTISEKKLKSHLRKRKRPTVRITLPGVIFLHRVCEKAKYLLVQGVLIRGGVQNKGTLIVSKSESLYVAATPF